MEAEFNKNVFMPNEKAEGEIKIDNSQCKVAVTRVTFAIIQELTQKIGHHHNREQKTIIKETVDGPGAEEGDWKKTLDIELDEIKYEVAEFKKKKGKEKRISDDDKFMMASLQPACHTKKFACEYFLTVTLEYDGCICTGDLPDAKMPMTIVPLVNPKAVKAQPDDDFNPTELGPINVDLLKDSGSD